MLLQVAGHTACSGISCPMGFVRDTAPFIFPDTIAKKGEPFEHVSAYNLGN